MNGNRTSAHAHPDPNQSMLASIDQAMLTPLVRRALGSKTVQVTDWECQPIYGGAGEVASIYRFSGDGYDQGETVPWSLVLKIVRAMPGREAPSSPGYWRREPLTYQSGVLHDLPGGLAAPQCLGMTEYPEEAFWLWLEDVQDEIGDRWPMEHYGVVARHLGQFNGAYLVGRPMPAGSWVSESWLRGYVEQAAPVFARLRDSLDRPLIRRLLPGDKAGELLYLWENRETFLSVLDRLPQTFCHLDAFRRNLFARRAPDGSEQTVAIDWAFAGKGAIGEELVPLVGAGIAFFEIELTQAQELDEIVFEGYLEGLRDAGWRGDPKVARLGYKAGLSVRYRIGGLAEVLPIVFDEKQHPFLEQVFGRPMEQLMDLWTTVASEYGRLSKEVRELLDSVQ
jgi:hypothetical protein